MRKLFPNVPAGTWHTWCRAARMREQQPADMPLPPTFPAPVVSAVVPVASGEPMAFDARLALLDAVAIAMLDTAWPTDPETGSRATRVKNPMMAKAAAAILRDSSALWARHHESERNAERFCEQLDELGDALGSILRDAGDKALTGRIISAFRRLNERWRELGAKGINIAAEEVEK
ncbi:hypothetical protein [Cupriavidus sp. UYPR2.512]|uniref:hypothetical protein n=1 Tax=Cupriavidus sp. UYPR2.512 TaxID=1080187 RepID=UPI0018DF45F4|nr:hypothetical protein [Cupriavidus sp. UYPR2.512]